MCRMSTHRRCETDFNVNLWANNGLCQICDVLIDEMNFVGFSFIRDYRLR